MGLFDYFMIWADFIQKGLKLIGEYRLLEIV